MNRGRVEEQKHHVKGFKVVQVKKKKNRNKMRRDITVEWSENNQIYIYILKRK